MKFVSTLSPKFQLAFVPTVCRKWSCKIKFMHRPWAACARCTQSLHSSALPSPPSVYFSSALNVYPAVEAEAYCESPFSLLQEEVCTLQHFIFHTCDLKRDRKV